MLILLKLPGLVYKVFGAIGVLACHEGGTKLTLHSYWSASKNFLTCEAWVCLEQHPIGALSFLIDSKVKLNRSCAWSMWAFHVERASN